MFSAEFMEKVGWAVNAKIRNTAIRQQINALLPQHYGDIDKLHPAFSQTYDTLWILTCLFTLPGAERKKAIRDYSKTFRAAFIDNTIVEHQKLGRARQPDNSQLRLTCCPLSDDYENEVLAEIASLGGRSGRL